MIPFLRCNPISCYQLLTILVEFTRMMYIRPHRHKLTKTKSTQREIDFLTKPWIDEFSSVAIPSRKRQRHEQVDYQFRDIRTYRRWIEETCQKPDRLKPAPTEVPKFADIQYPRNVGIGKLPCRSSVFFIWRLLKEVFRDIKECKIRFPHPTVFCNWQPHCDYSMPAEDIRNSPSEGNETFHRIEQCFENPSTKTYSIKDEIFKCSDQGKSGENATIVLNKETYLLPTTECIDLHNNRGDIIPTLSHPATHYDRPPSNSLNSPRKPRNPLNLIPERTSDESYWHVSVMRDEKVSGPHDESTNHSNPAIPAEDVTAFLVAEVLDKPMTKLGGQRNKSNTLESTSYQRLLRRKEAFSSLQNGIKLTEMSGTYFPPAPIHSSSQPTHSSISPCTAATVLHSVDAHSDCHTPAQKIRQANDVQESVFDFRSILQEIEDRRTAANLRQRQRKQTRAVAGPAMRGEQKEFERYDGEEEEEEKADSSLIAIASCTDDGDEHPQFHRIRRWIRGVFIHRSDNGLDPTA